LQTNFELGETGSAPVSRASAVKAIMLGNRACERLCGRAFAGRLKTLVGGFDRENCKLA
jgi:hypothetical protein